MGLTTAKCYYKTSNKKEGRAMEETQNFINTFALVVQIITNFFVLIGGIIAIYEYTLNRKQEFKLRQQEIYQRDKEKITKAAELAGYYKDNILPNLREIKKIFKSSGIFEILEKMEMGSIKEFDIVELEENLSSQDRQRIKELGTPQDLTTAMLKEGVAYNIDYGTLMGVIGGQDTEAKNQESEQCNTYPKDNYAELIVNTLNSLEYFSMYFVHNVADHTVVYQSLHMTFLEALRMLYYNISSINVKGEQKFYVNTIILFRTWSKMAQEQRAQENSNMRSAISCYYGGKNMV